MQDRHRPPGDPMNVCPSSYDKVTVGGEPREPGVGSRPV